jgi:GT2 family glycosyltransferase
MMDKVAVVILNWNGKAMMGEYLSKVVRLSEEATVIVADNASTDDSVPFLQAKFPEVRVIRLNKNWGFAEGYNRALRLVDAQYYVLLNSDVDVTQHWLTPLVRFMDQHPDVAACQPKLLAVADHSAFEYAGAAGGFVDALGYPFCRGRIFDTVEKDHGQYDTTAEVMWATGACMVVRAEDFHRFGGFDARFFAHNEEIDLCWRFRIGGKKVFCVAESRVYHVGGGTLPKGNPMKAYLNFRNNLTMLYKNLPKERLRRVMLLRWVLDYVAAYQTLLCGNVGDFKAIYKARHDFRKWKHEFDGERQKIQQMRKETESGQLAPCSILWQYYVRRHRYYTSLPLTK